MRMLFSFVGMLSEEVFGPVCGPGFSSLSSLSLVLSLCPSLSLYTRSGGHDCYAA